MAPLVSKLTDSQRYFAVIALTAVTLIMIAAVNLYSSIGTRGDVRLTKEIVAVCANNPHGLRCQKEAMPRVFADATPQELLRYQIAIERRREVLEGGARP